MRLTKQTNYAIRMMMYCDSNEGLSRVSSIADFFGISEKFLMKILQTLTKSGFINSVRGRNGGICLARPASEICIGDVIRVTEDNFTIAECFVSGETACPLFSSCVLNEALTEALDAFMAVLDTYTLADLTNNSSNIHVLLQLDVSRHIPLGSQPMNS